MKLISFTDFNHDVCIFVVFLCENFSIDYVFNHIDLLLQLVKCICLQWIFSGSKIIHEGQIFPIDAKIEDIIQNKDGVLSFSLKGFGETLFTDSEVEGEILKQLEILVKIHTLEVD